MKSKNPTISPSSTVGRSYNPLDEANREGRYGKTVHRVQRGGGWNGAYIEDPASSLLYPNTLFLNERLKSNWVCVPKIPQGGSLGKFAFIPAVGPFEKKMPG